MTGNQAELQIIEHMHRRAVAQGIPLSGTFELTPLCSMACKMCYVRMSQEELAATGKRLRTAEEWLALAREAKEQGMLLLLLTGGEPFVYPEFRPLYSELRKMGFVISINSNATLITEETVAWLRENPPQRINITLYGASDATYEALCRAKGVFSRVDRAITGLRDAGVIVKLNGSLTPQNAPDLEQMIRYAGQRDLIYEANTYMFPPLRRDPSMIGQNERFTPEEAAYYHFRRYRLQYGDELYRKFVADIAAGIAPPPGLDESCIDPLDGKIRCRAGKAAFWITWDGYLTPCGMMPEPKVDLTGRTFAAAWQDLTEQSAALTLSGVCTTCPNQNMCHSCAAMAMAETGTASGIPRYLCEMAQAMKTLAQRELSNL